MDTTGEKTLSFKIELVITKNLVNMLRLLERVAPAQTFLHVVNNRSTEGDRFSGSVFF